MRNQAPVLVARVVSDPESSLPAPVVLTSGSRRTRSRKARGSSGRHARPGRARRTLFGAAVTVLVGFLMSMGLSGSTTSASAIGLPCFGAVEMAPSPASAGSGTALFGTSVPFEGPFGDKPVTAYENYGVGGLFWSEYRPENDEDNADDRPGCLLDKWGSAANNMIANEVFSFSTSLTQYTVGMYKWATDPDMLAGLTEPIDCIVKGCAGGKGLDEVLYLDYLRPIIIFAALWAAWVGLVKRRTTEAAQGGLWVLGAATFALVFMTYPGLIAEKANGFVGEMNSSVMEGVASATTVSVPEQDVCYLPEGEPQRGTRVAACSLYKAMAFTPWAAGQFGVPVSQPLESSFPRPVEFGGVARNDMRIVQLEAQTIDHDEAENYDAAKYEDQNRWGSVMYDISEDRPELFPMWAGDQAGERVNIAFSSVLAALCVGLLVMLISFSTVVLALGMMLLIVIAPVFLLIGVHPGFGRGIGLKWLELLIGTVFKRIVLSIMLAVIIGLYQIVLQTPMPWFSQIGLVLAIGVGAIIFRKPLLDTLNVVNLGGTRTGMENGAQGTRAAKKAGAGAIGAASGAVSAGAAGGAGAMLAGAVSGGMMGSRSGSVMRAGTMGAGAGRRSAGRKKARDARNETDENPGEKPDKPGGKNPDGPGGKNPDGPGGPGGKGGPAGGPAGGGPVAPPTPPVPRPDKPEPGPGPEKPTGPPRPGPEVERERTEQQRERRAAQTERREAEQHRRTTAPAVQGAQRDAERAAANADGGGGGMSPLEQRLLDQARGASSNGNAAAPTGPPRPDTKRG